MTTAPSPRWSMSASKCRTSRSRRRIRLPRSVPVRLSPTASWSSSGVRLRRRSSRSAIGIVRVVGGVVAALDDRRGAHGVVRLRRHALDPGLELNVGGGLTIGAYDHLTWHHGPRVSPRPRSRPLQHWRARERGARRQADHAATAHRGRARRLSLPRRTPGGSARRIRSRVVLEPPSRKQPGRSRFKKGLEAVQAAAGGPRRCRGWVLARRVTQRGNSRKNPVSTGGSRTSAG